MPVPKEIVVECPKCSFTKVVTRGDCLPDASMFQKCPKCGEMMHDSKQNIDDVNGVLNTILELFKK